MEPERTNIFSSKISAQSKKSNASSFRSFDRFTFSSKSHSLNKNHSLIEVMSLESSKKSDIYERMIAQPMQQQFSCSNKQQRSNPFKSTIKNQNQHQQLNRSSYQVQNSPQHVCLCYRTCLKQRCPCFTSEDACSSRYCCTQCFENPKNKSKSQLSSISVEKTVTCTCKKNKCIKKYCTCMSAGEKCSNQCSCEDCLNCDKPLNTFIEPKFIGDSSVQQMEMPSGMDFEPFNYPSLN